MSPRQLEVELELELMPELMLALALAMAMAMLFRQSIDLLNWVHYIETLVVY